MLSFASRPVERPVPCGPVMIVGICLGLSACSLDRAPLFEGMVSQVPDSTDAAVAAMDASVFRDGAGPMNVDAGAPSDAGAAPDASGVVDSGVDAGPRCDAALCPGRRCEADVCAHYESCAVLRASDGSLPTGVYEVWPASASEPFSVYCEMRDAGGGWTLLLKADGAFNTFHYDADYWENEALLNASSLDMSYAEAKLRGYSLIPFDSIRMGLVDADSGSVSAEWVQLDIPGSSLRALFSAGSVVVGTPSRDDWLDLDGEFRLQRHCNRRGINARGDYDESTRIRIGIIANEQNDCGTPDSYIGVGACDGWVDCTDPFQSVAVGNVGEYLGAGQPWVYNRRFAYVFVR